MSQRKLLAFALSRISFAARPAKYENVLFLLSSRWPFVSSTSPMCPYDPMLTGKTVPLTSDRCSFRRIHTSRASLGRGSRLRPAEPEFTDSEEKYHEENPQLQPNALPEDEELEEIASATRPRRGKVIGDADPAVHPEAEEYSEGTFTAIGAEPSARAKVRDQSLKVPRPAVDPKRTTVVLFPGQGSQFVGMGKRLLDYPNVSEIYSWASDILGYNLLKLCLEGPIEELTRTVHCQAAIFVTEIAALEKLKEDYPQAVESCVAAAGFSVGEYAALVFGGSLDFEDALRIVKARGEAMQAASEMVSGGMMTVNISHKTNLSKAMEVARQWCKEKKGVETPVCVVANYLHPDTKVIAGNSEALDFLEANANTFNLESVKRLNVSGAFHSRLMSVAEEDLYPVLKQVEIKKPGITVYSNMTGLRYGPSSKKNMRMIFKQMSHPVKWEQCLHAIYERKQDLSFPHTYEVGPGRQLGALLRKVNAKAFASYTAIEV